jgi:hypothetical protein
MCVDDIDYATWENEAELLLVSLVASNYFMLPRK